MNIFEIFSKSRQELIESLEFLYFLFDGQWYLETKYQKSKNPLIKFSLKVLN